MVPSQSVSASQRSYNLQDAHSPPKALLVSLSGSIFGGLLSGPFLSETDDQTDNSTTTETPSVSTLKLNEWSEISGQVDSRIQIPYLIVSIVLILAAIWLIISQILWVSCNRRSLKSSERRF